MNLKRAKGVITQATALRIVEPRHLDIAQGHLRKAVKEVVSKVKERPRPGKYEPPLTRMGNLRYDRLRRK